MMQQVKEWQDDFEGMMLLHVATTDKEGSFEVFS